MLRYQNLYENKDLTTDTQTALSSFKSHNQLNPEFWFSNGRLKPEIHDDLLKIGEDFYNSLQISAPLIDLQFTGSLANFSFSIYSDIDLHLIVDYSAVDENSQLVEDYFMAKKNLWNIKHDIEIFGYPVEIYVQDLNGNAVSSGVYSIMKDEWIQEPSPGHFDFDSEEVLIKVKSLMSEIDNAIDQNSIELADKFWDKLKRLRQEGLREDGEYSTGNLAMKLLRRNGYLDKLSSFEDQLYDKQLSI